MIHLNSKFRIVSFVDGTRCPRRLEPSPESPPANVYGLWFTFMVYGLWFMVYDLWFMVYVTDLGGLLCISGHAGCVVQIR